MPPRLYFCDATICCNRLPGTPVSARTARRHFAEALARQRDSGLTEPRLKRARLAYDGLPTGAPDEVDEIRFPSTLQPVVDPSESHAHWEAPVEYSEDHSEGAVNARARSPLSGKGLSDFSTDDSLPDDSGFDDSSSSSSDDERDLRLNDDDHQQYDIRQVPAGVQKSKESSELWKDIILWQDRHHITRSAVDDLLEILSVTGNFPSTTWQSVRNNLHRASMLDAKSGVLGEKIPYCAGHMLLNVPGPAESSLAEAYVTPTCSQPDCSQLKPSGVFETIPITPRVSALWKNKKCREMLFKSAIAREKQMADAESRGIFEDVASGKAYRSLFHALGGPAAVRTDIFLVFSTDGFQVYKKRKGTATVVAALCLNFPPDLRYMINNIITIAVVPGPREPTCLESFLIPFYREIESINSNGRIRVDFEDEGKPHTIFSRVHIVYASWRR